MSEIAAPTPDQPESPEVGSLSASSISFQLLQIDIRQTVLVPPEYLRAYHEVNPELAAKIVEHNLRVQERLAKPRLRTRREGGISKAGANGSRSVSPSAASPSADSRFHCAWSPPPFGSDAVW
jgi:hypothetical protein